MVYRFIIQANGIDKNFLKISETLKYDLIISSRGKRHVAIVDTPQVISHDIDDQDVTISNITVHPNLKSKIKSVTINYKDIKGNTEERIIAGVLGIRTEFRLFPVLTSIGRSIGAPSLTFRPKHVKNVNIIELWPGNGIDLSKDSLAYSVVICSPHVQFELPDDFPRNVISLRFQYIQILLFYWLFNNPTKFRGTTLTLSTSKKYMNGFQLHEILNFTNDMTLAHAKIYPNLPEL